MTQINFVCWNIENFGSVKINQSTTVAKVKTAKGDGSGGAKKKTKAVETVQIYRLVAGAVKQRDADIVGFVEFPKTGMTAKDALLGLISAFDLADVGRHWNGCHAVAGNEASALLWDSDKLVAVKPDGTPVTTGGPAFSVGDDYAWDDHDDDLLAGTTRAQLDPTNNTKLTQLKFPTSSDNFGGRPGAYFFLKEKSSGTFIAVVLYHAPYGPNYYSPVGGHRLASSYVLKHRPLAWDPSTDPAQTHAVAAGDFNVNWDDTLLYGGTLPELQGKTRASVAYDDLKAFMADGLTNQLTSLADKPPSAPKKTAEMLVNSYDHIFTKGFSAVTNAMPMDVIAWSMVGGPLEPLIADWAGLAILKAQAWQSRGETLSTWRDAHTFYTKLVSDHLPVAATLTVP